MPDGSYYVGGTDELTFHNPMQILNEETAYLENLRFLGSYYVNLKFWDDRISFKNSLNTDITQFYDYTNYNENHPYGKGVGRIVDRNQTVKNILLESVLNYSDSFMDEDALSLNVMLGHSFQNVGTHNATLDGSGFPSPSFDVIGVASAIDDYSGNLYNYTMESYFGRVNLSYKDRYVLTATLRTDGSSKFAPEYRWGWFPSVSFGWNISNESFMENSGTDLKFRLSYGKTGNQEGIGTFAYQAQMAGGMNYNEQSGIYVTEFGNDALTWEKADQFDAGFDMSFLDDRLTVIIDGYLKNTRDLLYSMPIHGTTGTTSIISNVGSMRNIGAELTLGTSLDLGPVHWTSQFNISTNRNRITSLPGDGSPISIGSNRALQVGKEMGFFIYSSITAFSNMIRKCLQSSMPRAAGPETSAGWMWTTTGSSMMMTESSWDLPIRTFSEDGATLSAGEAFRLTYFSPICTVTMSIPHRNRICPNSVTGTGCNMTMRSIAGQALALPMYGREPLTGITTIPEILISSFTTARLSG